jgi:acyl-CoA ligase (AMP-forming) (exosortase A-associated)
MLPEFTLYHMLLNSVERDPAKTAIVDGSRSGSYEDLCRQAAGLAAALRARGLRRGDRVGVLLDKSWEAVAAMFGVMQAGGVFVNISPQLKEPQIQHIMRDCTIRMLIGQADRLQALDLPKVDATWAAGEVKALPNWSGAVSPLDAALSETTAAAGTNAIENDLCTIIYTSGSTGRPKGIMLSHRNLAAGAQIVSTYLENTPQDRVLSVLPFNFDAGLNQLTTMVRVGGTLVLQRSLLPGDILRNLRREGITGLAGVPPVWVLLLQNRRSLKETPLEQLRYLTNTGGMIPNAHLQELIELLPHTRIFLMYGLTEAFRSTYLPPEEVHRGPACIGKAIPNTDIWVVDAQGRECAPGEVGELVHRGPTVALGYWGDDEKTRSVYRANPFAPPQLQSTDVVVHSGDLVKRDEEGFLYFIGRRDELIKTQGYRVSPQEVEEVLYANPSIHEAVAFGEADGAYGQSIVALVSLKKGAAAQEGEIREHFGRLAPNYMVPKTIRILDELPKTSTGKLDRSALKELHAGSKKSHAGS